MTGRGEATPATSARLVAHAAPKAGAWDHPARCGPLAYESLVAVATDHDGAPLLLSDLPEHARNLKDCERASLLFDAPAREDPQFREPIERPETARAVLVGLAERVRTPLAAQHDVAHEPSDGASILCCVVLRGNILDHPALWFGRRHFVPQG